MTRRARGADARRRMLDTLDPDLLATVLLCVTERSMRDGVHTLMTCKALVARGERHRTDMYRAVGRDLRGTTRAQKRRALLGRLAAEARGRPASPALAPGASYWVRLEREREVQRHRHIAPADATRPDHSMDGSTRAAPRHARPLAVGPGVSCASVRLMETGPREGAWSQQGARH